MLQGLKTGTEIPDAELIAEWRTGDEVILSTPAVDFVTDLVRVFRDQVEGIRYGREYNQESYDAGELPDFDPYTLHVRKGKWKVSQVPEELQRRIVEITGPVDRKMIINALNSGADVFMADFEDSSSPTWDNMVEGQRNLYDAVRGTIEYEHPRTGKKYSLNDQHAVLFVRPRGLHLDEAHFLVDDERVPASLFDFGLYFFHNAKALIEAGSGPYFYLPKLQGADEARFWNDVFVWSQARLGIPEGTIKATVLIETLPAAFEMDEILYELRHHSAGLNCGRWDYIFSYIKTLREHEEYVLPDRSQVTMETPFMQAYARLLVQTCHRRGAHAMGGMAAQIPIKGDEERNAAAMEKVRLDKEREAQGCHDGTWVAHPGLIQTARKAFMDQIAFSPNQLGAIPTGEVTQADLLTPPEDPECTEEGLRQNVRVGIQYLAAWLQGNGCVPLYDLMEDAATAEISRTQVWQWLKHGKFTVEQVESVIEDEARKLINSYESATPHTVHLGRAEQIFRKLTTKHPDYLEDFLTLLAYPHIVKKGPGE